LTLLCGSVIHSTKFATAVCTTSATLARWEASSSAKNGNLSCIADTAWVENRPEYCFNRRSTDSGTPSSSSSVDRGGADLLSATPKIYAIFWMIPLRRGGRPPNVRLASRSPNSDGHPLQAPAPGSDV